MKQMIFKRPYKINVLVKPSQGVITHVRLNRHELVCIELALIGLAEALQQNNVAQPLLTNANVSHLSAQLCYLQRWMDNPELKSQLRNDGKNTVLWPCTSSELVDWLLLACQYCISEDAVLITAANAASVEYQDYAELYANNDYNHSLSDELSYENFAAFQCYYNEIVKNCKENIITKLAFIRDNDYPLFPMYSVN